MKLIQLAASNKHRMNRRSTSNKDKIDDNYSLADKVSFTHDDNYS